MAISFDWLSIRCFSSERLEAARLVKWNVDYLAVRARTAGQYNRFAGVETHSTDDERSGTLLGPEGSARELHLLGPGATSNDLPAGGYAK